jgi:hypothetical protein
MRKGRWVIIGLFVACLVLFGESCRKKTKYTKCQFFKYSMTCAKSDCRNNRNALVICTPCKAVGDDVCRVYCENCGSGDHVKFERFDE